MAFRTVILVWALGLSACGQKGPLYFPEPGTPAPDTEQDSDADKGGNPESGQRNSEEE